MKANFKYAIMAVAALTLGLTSCKTDDPPGGGVDKGRETYMRISILFPSNNNMSRATNDPNATNDEAAVKTMDVFIYNAGGAYSSHTHLEPGDFTAVTSATKDVYETMKIRTTTGLKTVLVGVNLPSNIVAGLEHKSLYEVQVTAQTLIRAQMTNLAGGIPMFSTKIISSTLVADETDPANKIAIDVKRMVAKVTVERSLNMEQAGVAGVLGPLAFAINNFNEKSYLIQNAAPDYKDPNWSSGSYSSYDFSDAGPSDWKAIVNKVSDNDVKTLEANYAAENTSQDTKMSEITRATVRSTFMPNSITVYANGTDNTNGFTTADRANDLNITVPQTFYTVTSSITSSTAYFYNSNIADDYVAINGGTKVTYTDGVCYWNMFLNKGRGNTGKQWDVLRNEYFRCQITRIIAPGNPTPDVKDPDAVPDEETNITVTVTPLFWNTPVLADYDLEP